MIKRLLLSSTFLFALMLSPAHSQQAVKLGTVDMEKIFSEYHKTKKARERLKEREDEAKEELQERMDAYTAVLEEINMIQEEANSEELSEEVKDEKRQEFQQKAAEAQRLEKEITDFRTTRQRQIQEQINRMRRGLINEIIEEIEKKVEVEGYDLVFDSTGLGASGYPLVLYSRQGLDFTDDIVEIMNESPEDSVTE